MLQKPLIRRAARGWSCSGLGKEGLGGTLRGAYMDWLNEAALHPYL